MARRRKKKGRNRKQQNNGFVFPTPLASILVTAAVLSLLYLWLDSRCEAAGVRIQRLESRLGTLRERVKTEDARWSSMSSLARVQRELLRHHIVMYWPDESRIIRLTETEQVASASPVAFRQYAMNRRIHVNE